MDKKDEGVGNLHIPVLYLDAVIMKYLTVLVVHSRNLISL